MTEARAQLTRSKLVLEALQTRLNSLSTDIVNRDDPAQRAVLERDRQDTLREMGRLKKDIQDQTKAISDIEEEARRASVPPGWLR
jgi:seryl-tRNA synthetase